MKQYKVLRNCWGFQKRYWAEGKIVDLPDDANPPHHFEFIGRTPDPEPYGHMEPKVQEETPKKVDVMAPKQVEIGKPIRTVGGFAAKADFTAPQEVLTAAQAHKRGRPRKE